MKKDNRTIALIITVAVLLIAANIAEIALVFGITTAQTKQNGADRLEIIGGELEETINTAKRSTMSLALEVMPYLENDDGRKALTELIETKKRENLALTGGVCFNTYIAGDGWFIIPDFDKPDDYEISERSWYRGALKTYGDAFVTDPYIDAMTGRICFTVSVRIDDKNVVATDYTMQTIQQHIKQMNESGTQQAIIVTQEGIIAGCSEEELIGKGLVQELPDYAGIYSLVKNSDTTVSIKQRGENLFAAHSGFGWYLIVSENNWSLYKSSYFEMLLMLLISLSIFGIVAALYVRTAKREKATIALLNDERAVLKGFVGALREPADRISSIASIENVKSSADYEQEFAVIREAGAELSQMLGRLRSYSRLEEGEDSGSSVGDRPREVVAGRHFRSIILGALLLVMGICIYINLTYSRRYGEMHMQRTVSSYEYRLSEWINTQKSILDMFCSNISTHPELLEDYEGAVEYLDSITGQYPEISVSYMTNPEFEHTVIMNNGWEPDDDWHVEERAWYKELMASDKDWIISSPYYDEQTGLYCVTFAKRVYDDKTGKALGNFGIDFYMDKLVDILGSSYTDSSYAFLADAKGEILNHPYGRYQMSESGSKNVIELPYNTADPGADSVHIIKDYDGRYKAVIATRNAPSGFSIYVVDSLGNIYRDVAIFGAVCIIALSVCVVIVYKVMTGLITLQNAANAKLKESADAAIAADKAKSDFLAQMSHEIRTPINAVLGLNEMIIHQSGDERIREYAADIRSSGRTLLTLINSILDFSKIEDGKMKIIPAEYETATFINDLVTAIQPRAEAKGLSFTVDADGGLPCVLKGDDVRLKQVVLNLLTNAVKYTEKGTVTLIIRGGKPVGDETSLYFEVSDTGIGIREEDIGALFESFKRLDEKRNRHIEGTGLGMSIVTRLLAMMDSELKVGSVYGEGSSFSFELKQGVLDPEPMGDYRSRLTEELNSGTGSRHLYAPAASVLVVDDNPMNLRVAENLLSLYGIKADTASSGEGALEMIGKAKYDLVFLDHMMPGMDGLEVMERFKNDRKAGSGTVFVALTANAIIGAKEMYISAGFDDYLTKPIERRELEKLLNKHLPEGKRLYREESPKKPVQSAVGDDSFTAEEIMELYDICPQVNVAAGLHNCMESKEFWLDTLNGFVQADKSAELEKAFETGDLERYRIEVHSIKSAAKTIGAEVLSEQARLLEFAARDSQTGYIKANHAQFTEEYKKLNEAIRRVIEK